MSGLFSGLTASLQDVFAASIIEFITNLFANLLGGDLLGGILGGLA